MYKESKLMIIQRICSAQFNIMPMMSRADSNSQRFGIRMAQPVSVDTVSFQGKAPKKPIKELAALARKEARAMRDARQIAEAKKAPDKTAPTKKNLSGEERKRGVSISTAKQIHDMILKPQKIIDTLTEDAFGDLVATEFAPKNPILKMSGRAKSIISINEKCATRDCNSVEEALEIITDFNGRKKVLNFKTGKEDAENILDRYIPLIKTRQYILKEIELQRPAAIKNLSKKEQEEYDYISKTFLDKLEDAQEEVLNGLETKVDKIKLIDRPLPRYTKGNYCALHLLLEPTAKNARPFELQVMGARVSEGKSLDDKRFKFFDGKELDKMYAPLVSLWERLMPEENAAAKERFLQYCKDANLQLRQDEIQEFKTKRIINRPNGLFKSVREYGLPPEYDLNYQYKLMRQCEADAAKAKKKEETTTQSISKKIEQKVAEVEKRVVVVTQRHAGKAKEKVDITKEKLQKLVAKYTPIHMQNKKKK